MAKTGWQGFQAQGHTGFADRGEDIVCAAVSVLTQTAVLGLDEVLSIRCHVEVDEETGRLRCLLPKRLSEATWEQAQLVLKILYAGLNAVQEQYGKYVSVKEVPYRENESTTLRLQKGRRKH